LTQVPDAMQIKIYTIAGRLIKTLNVEQNTLRVGFNKTVVWDGTDDDGALAASGVYLYKCIVSKKGQKSVATQKLAIIR
jgi:flagellar hook assembly protein FlgD